MGVVHMAEGQEAMRYRMWVASGVSITRTSSNSIHRVGDPVRYICHQRIVDNRRPRRSVTGHKDWYTVVVVTAPVIDLFHGIATSGDSAGLFDFIQKLTASSRCIHGFRCWRCVRSKPVPLVKRMKLSPPGLPGWASDVPIKRHRHVEHRFGHAVALSLWNV